MTLDRKVAIWSTVAKKLIVPSLLDRSAGTIFSACQKKVVSLHHQIINELK